MNDDQRNLLIDHHTLILPESIDHSCYELVVEACLVHPERFELHCRGNGGSAKTARAMVDIIRGHGKVVGILAGAAESAHGIIFAGCSIRYCYPHASLGVHQIAWYAAGDLDGVEAAEIARWTEIQERKGAALFASICNAEPYNTTAYWMDVMRQVGRKRVRDVESEQLISLGMAQPI